MDDTRGDRVKCHVEGWGDEEAYAFPHPGVSELILFSSVACDYLIDRLMEAFGLLNGEEINGVGFHNCNDGNLLEVFFECAEIPCGTFND